MIDYRKSIVELMNVTKGTEESLKQSAVALKCIIDILEIKESETAEFRKCIDYIKNDNIENETTATEREKAETVETDDIRNFYHIKRCLKGAKLVDENGKQVKFFTESEIHALDWHTGDIAETVTEDGELVVKNVTAQHEDRDEIVEFPYAIAEEDSHGFYVTRNIYNEELGAVNRRTFYIDADVQRNLHLEDGDILTLAWYIKCPENIVVRWKELNVGPLTDGEKSTAITGRKQKAKSSDTEKKEKAQLDFSITGQKVAVIVGEPDKIRTDVEQMIAEHGGETVMIDAFKGSDCQNSIKRQIEGCSIVVTVQTYCRHRTSEAVMEMARENGMNTAIAKANSLQAIERAVYRAVSGLPAYETTNAVDYPMFSDRN